MMAARKIQATVQPGGKIEIVAPDLASGQTVEIIILSPNGAGAKRSAMDILRESPPPRLFRTADEVDAYLRQERDAWSR